ncbi:CASP8 [Mytilus edulis]|uniref:Caspase-8 n=1 Tax=Mytilus edulis TaxID=6550 RepID=A0A8S3TUP7_MYTED|nr:CASP8 [Mytilus edulis]
MANLRLRQILVEICSDLGSDDLEKLKFLLRDVTGSAKLEMATMAIDIFSAIERNKHVALHDGSYLAECFSLIGRIDLVRKLELDPRRVEVGMETDPRLFPFRILLYKISEDLSDKEFEQLKYHSTSINVLKDMLKALHRGDLLELVVEYQAKYPHLIDGENNTDSININGATQTLESPVVDQYPSLPSRPQNGGPQTTEPSPMHVYEMNAFPRGFCIIINNNNFYPQSGFGCRVGSDEDARMLDETFCRLGFIVKIYNDFTVKDMAAVMHGLSRLDHSKYNAVVVCILSHGGEHVVYGVDGKEIAIRYLTSFFRSSKCKSLANKPKLFFIQACQGNERQTGINQTDLSIQADGPSDLEEGQSFPETDAEDVGRSNNSKIIPDESDFLIGYATVTGYTSFRSRTRGSFYIRKLTENLNQYANSQDLISILTRVNHDVSTENIPAGNNYEISKQVPMPQFTLRKQLFFRPENLPHDRTMPQSAAGLSIISQSIQAVRTIAQPTDATKCKTNNIDYINNSNLVKLTGCTKIIGNINVVEATFEGDPYLNIPALHPYQLDVFKSVKEITGVLVVQGKHKDFKDLSFLGNLTTIYGRGAKRYQGASLSVAYSSIEALNLSSLKRIRNGNVVIAFNDRLCYANTVKFTNLFRRKEQLATVVKNRSKLECDLTRKRCSTVCGTNGCWGPRRENCVGNITENNSIEDSFNIVDML